MKLISLNTWGGKQFTPLKKFIINHAKNTDIFCFQEIFSTSTKKFKYSGYRLNLYYEISKALKNFQGYYAPAQDRYVLLKGFVNFDLSYGLAIFTKKNIKIISQANFFVFGKRNGLDANNLNFTQPKNLQHVSFTDKDSLITICNFHGIWFPGPKIDTPLRIEQSKKIAKFLNNQKGQKILCGDFNLSENTQSLKILERSMQNLIKEYKISTTRSRLYDRTDDKFADYTFVSPNVTVIDFQVPNIDVSDHLPMILEFS